MSTSKAMLGAVDLEINRNGLKISLKMFKCGGKFGPSMCSIGNQLSYHSLHCSIVGSSIIGVITSKLHHLSRA